MNSITDQKRTFEEDGFLMGRNLISEEEIIQLSEKAQNNYELEKAASGSISLSSTLTKNKMHCHEN